MSTFDTLLNSVDLFGYPDHQSFNVRLEKILQLSRLRRVQNIRESTEVKRHEEFCFLKLRSHFTKLLDKQCPNRPSQLTPLAPFGGGAGLGFAQGNQHFAYRLPAVGRK